MFLSPERVGMDSTEQEPGWLPCHPAALPAGSTETCGETSLHGATIQF